MEWPTNNMWDAFIVGLGFGVIIGIVLQLLWSGFIDRIKGRRL